MNVVSSRHSSKKLFHKRPANSGIDRKVSVSTATTSTQVKSVNAGISWLETVASPSSGVGCWVRRRSGLTVKEDFHSGPEMFCSSCAPRVAQESNQQPATAGQLQVVLLSEEGTLIRWFIWLNQTEAAGSQKKNLVNHLSRIRPR